MQASLDIPCGVSSFSSSSSLCLYMSYTVCKKTSDDSERVSEFLTSAKKENTNKLYASNILLKLGRIKIIFAFSLMRGTLCVRVFHLIPHSILLTDKTCSLQHYVAGTKIPDFLGK